jgi:hypothetical protein
MVDRGVIE